MALDRNALHQWHVAINRHHDGLKEPDRKPWMYEAKSAASEVPRLALLFKMARCGELPKVHRACSRSAFDPIADNRLTCCLGVRCDACPALQALDAMEATPEVVDQAKAWTCATHIVSQGGDWAREGYLLTVDDRMYWDGVYENLASGGDPDAT